jgi:xanthine dehydrogenase YagS FAD-binding subunit
MKSFRHFTAETINAGTTLLERYEGRAAINAGGTDLLGILKDRILPESPEAVIDIKKIPGLDQIRETADGLRIGALARLSDVAASPLVTEKYTSLALAACSVATPVIRSMATLGGNLCQAVRCWYYRYPHEVGGRILCHRKGGKSCPAETGDNRYHAILGAGKCLAVCPSDTATALAALGADIRIAGPRGVRTVPVERFFTSLGIDLDSGEMVTEIRIPAPPPESKQAFIKIAVRKPVDFAIVSAASVIAVRDGLVTDTRISLGAVAPAPVRAAAAEQALIGKPLSPGTIQATADAAVSDAKPLARNAYKVELAKAAVRKVLEGSGLGVSGQ